MDLSEMQYILENCEFFKGVDKSNIQKIAAFCHIKTYEPGEYVFRQGDFEENLYIIAEGHVFLERSMDLGTRKGMVIVATLGKGRVFGCWSMLLDERHNLMSSAICQKPTRVAVMKGADLRHMMLANIDLGFKVMQRLCFFLRNKVRDAFGAMERI